MLVVDLQEHLVDDLGHGRVLHPHCTHNRHEQKENKKMLVKSLERLAIKGQEAWIGDHGTKRTVLTSSVSNSEVGSTPEDD